PYVGANLDIMRSDTEKVRGENPFVFTNLKTDEGLDEVVEWFNHSVLMKDLV
nr:urease accessory protein UreG [Actinomycetales bacterium]